MTLKEHLLKHLHESAIHHSAIGKAEAKISKAHADIAEAHTNQILAQGHRDLADHHGARAQHHQARAKHFSDVHAGLAGLAPELFDEHSDAVDELRSSAGYQGLLKRLGFVET